MIRYTLKCKKGHQFDSWFRSADAFDSLCAAGMTVCPVCGSAEVSKALMTPGVSTKDSTPAGPADAQDTGKTPALSDPASPAEHAIARLRKHVEENSDYVGRDFVREARKMHDGDTPHRPIYGEARLDEARSLAEDGVPVAPLPFTPKTKAN